MPKFSYVALDTRGKEISGVLESENTTAAVSRGCAESQRKETARPSSRRRRSDQRVCTGTCSFRG